jgi:hypothetical protein
MAKRENRHTNHSGYFAAPVLLLTFALQGFLPMVSVLAASDPLTETQTQSRQQEQIRDLRQQDQLQQLQRDQQLNNLQQELRSRPRDNRDPRSQQRLDENQRKLDQLQNDQRLDRLQTEQQLDQMQREQNQSRQQEQIRDLQRQQQMNLLQDQQRQFQIQRRQ